MAKPIAYLLVSSAIILWGLTGIFTKSMLDTGTGVLEITFWRLLLSGILFAIQALVQRDLKLKAKKDLRYMAAFAVFIIGLNYLSFNYAIAYGGISLANLLLALVPMLIALPACMFFREQLNIGLLILLILTIVGLILASWHGGEGIIISAASLGFSFVAALTSAAFTLASKDLVQRYTPVSMNAFIMPLAALVLLPFIEFTTKPFENWLDLTLLTLLPSYLAYLLYQAGLKHLQASRVALLTNLEPVTGLLLAALLFGERFSLLGLVGVMIVVAVSLFASLPQGWRIRKSSRPGEGFGPILITTTAVKGES